jgi:hypothetical protein
MSVGPAARTRIRKGAPRSEHPESTTRRTPGGASTTTRTGRCVGTSRRASLWRRRSSAVAAIPGPRRMRSCQRDQREASGGKDECVRRAAPAGPFRFGETQSTPHVRDYLLRSWLRRIRRPLALTDTQPRHPPTRVRAWQGNRLAGWRTTDYRAAALQADTCWVSQARSPS